MAASVTAFVFVLLFQGNISEGIAALISAVICILKEKVLRVEYFLSWDFLEIIAGA